MGFRRGPFGAALRGGPPVHAEMVVPKQGGSGFETVTMDAGKLKAIDAGKLTVTEGTDTNVYGEPVIDVGPSPTVVRNHQKAALSDLKTGDLVRIIRSSQGTFVMAEDATFAAQEKSDRGRGHGPEGRPGWGPPPGMPG
jgi:hypothetical protein